MRVEPQHFAESTDLILVNSSWGGGWCLINDTHFELSVLVGQSNMGTINEVEFSLSCLLREGD